MSHNRDAVHIQAKEPEQGVLKTSCVTSGEFDPGENKRVLAPNEVQRLKTPVRANSIIFSRMNTPALVGANAFVADDQPNLFLPDRLWEVRSNDEQRISTRWLSYVFGSDRMRSTFSEIGTGTSGSMKNISKSKLLAVKISLPPKEEQKCAVRQLEAIDESLEDQKTNLEVGLKLKAALMSDLLTGRKRVVA